MLQNVLLTNLAPLSIKTEANSWENQPFTTVWPEKKTKDISRTIKKKPKRVRTAFSTEQLRTLERTYSRYKYIDSIRRCELAKLLNIGEKSIKVWFQNRRMKEKKESSESSCDSSSDSFGNETPSVSVSPPLQMRPESNTQYCNQYFNCNHPDYSYQVPPTYNVHQNLSGVQSPYISPFYNDNNVYPTHYYPVDMNYSSFESCGYNNQYGGEINQYWGQNQSLYYAQI